MLSNAGLRIERLLYFGLILIFLCWAETYLSTAASYFSDTDNRVLDGLLQRLTSERPALESAFERKNIDVARSEREKRAAGLRKELGLPPGEAQNTDSGSYFALLQKIADESNVSPYAMEAQTFATISALIDTKKSPQEIIAAVTKQKNDSIKNTATVLGIEAPRFLSLQYGSTDFKIPSLHLSVILLIVIYPLAVVWLGSFYITRQRELMLIRLARDHKATFPHILNWVVIDSSRMMAQLGQQNSAKQRRITLRLNAVITPAFRCLIVALIVFLIVFPIGYSSLLLHATISPPLSVSLIGAVFLFVIIGLGASLFGQETYLLKGKVFYE